jgi:hypothetical protein
MLILKIGADHHLFELLGDVRDYEAKELKRIVNGSGNSWFLKGSSQVKYALYQDLLLQPM